MDIICRSCGSINDYRTQMINGQNVAHCNSCDSFIKNIPYSQEQPKMYFGKYKGGYIHDIDDLPYLVWLNENVNLKPERIKKAVEERISYLKVYWK